MLPPPAAMQSAPPPAAMPSAPPPVAPSVEGRSRAPQPFRPSYMVPVSNAPNVPTAPVDPRLVMRFGPPASTWSRDGQPSPMTVRELRDWYIRERTGNRRPASGDTLIDDLPVALMSPELFLLAAAHLPPSARARMEDLLRRTLERGQQCGIVDPSLQF